MLRIGELAARAKVSTRALRYYEEHGILTAQRTAGGQRLYAETAVERVCLIQQLYAAGLGSRTIAGILPSVEAGRAEPQVLESLRAERDRITAGIEDLEQARRRLDEVIVFTEHPERCTARH